MENKISKTKKQGRIIIIVAIIIGTSISGFLFSNIHSYLPSYFKIQAAYPYTDSFVMILSIIATILLAKKKIENWYLWIIVDFVCVVLYLKKGVFFLSLEYVIFLGLALYGFYHWRNKLIND